MQDDDIYVLGPKLEVTATLWLPWGCCPHLNYKKVLLFSSPQELFQHLRKCRGNIQVLHCRLAQVIMPSFKNVTRLAFVATLIDFKMAAAASWLMTTMTLGLFLFIANDTLSKKKKKASTSLFNPHFFLLPCSLEHSDYLLNLVPSLLLAFPD